MTSNTHRRTAAYEMLTEAGRHLRNAEMALNRARSEVDALEDGDGKPLWQGQFESGALWRISESIREQARAVHQRRAEIWKGA